MARYRPRKQEGFDWEAAKKGNDLMFPPASKKRTPTTKEGITHDKDGYPIDDTDTHKRVMERYRKRKETQRE